jgi:hypothetical protein
MVKENNSRSEALSSPGPWQLVSLKLRNPNAMQKHSKIPQRGRYVTLLTRGQAKRIIVKIYLDFSRISLSRRSPIQRSGKKRISSTKEKEDLSFDFLVHVSTNQRQQPVRR